MATLAVSVADCPTEDRKQGARNCPEGQVLSRPLMRPSASFRVELRMSHVISFRTARFDVSKETPNPINPIAGESVLLWLRPQLMKAGYKATEPDTEDWGWYIDVEGNGVSYLIGASADAEVSESEIDWTLQIEKVRSPKDKLLGRNKMASDDQLTALVEMLLRADSAIEQVSVDRNA